MANQDAGGVRLPIEWHCPDGISSHWTNHLIVQNAEEEFILSFFEMRPPMLLGSPDEQTEQLKKMDSVRAECVARLIVNPAKLESFIAVMQRVLDASRSTNESNESGETE